MLENNPPDENKPTLVDLLTSEKALVDDSNVESSSLIRVGAKFDSFKKFDSAFEKWKETFCHPFRVASSETLRTPDGSPNDRFKYRYIVYHCAHYGSPRMRGIGKRPNQNYMPCGCRAMLRLNYSWTENVLRITTLHTEHHGHDINTSCYSKFTSKVKQPRSSTGSSSTMATKDLDLLKTPDSTTFKHVNSSSASVDTLNRPATLANSFNSIVAPPTPLTPPIGTLLPSHLFPLNLNILAVELAKARLQLSRPMVNELDVQQQRAAAVFRPVQPMAATGLGCSTNSNINNSNNNLDATSRLMPVYQVLQQLMEFLLHANADHFRRAIVDLQRLLAFYKLL